MIQDMSMECGRLCSISQWNLELSTTTLTSEKIVSSFRASNPRAIDGKREEWVHNLKISPRMISSEKSQTSILKKLMIETANNAKRLGKTVDASRKEMERVGSSVREIQLATTGDKIGDIPAVNSKPRSRASTPSTPAVELHAISLDSIVTIVAEAMQLASKPAVKAKLEDSASSVASVDFRGAAVLLVRGGGPMSHIQDGKKKLERRGAPVREHIR